MLRVLIRRALGAIPILFGLSMLLFAWVRVLPGDPTSTLLRPAQGVGVRPASPEAMEELRRLYGLDRPLHRQYITYIGNVSRLELGQSISTRRPVAEEIRQRVPATVELATAALLVAVVVGIPAGMVAARRPRSWVDHLCQATAVLPLSVPVFVTAFLLKYLLAVKLGWLPTSGRLDVAREAAHPTGLYVLDAILALDGPALVDALRHLALPAVTLALAPAAVLARVTRTAALGVSREDFVRTAMAKGLPARVVSRRHVLRPALLPALTIIGVMAGFLLSGAVLIEVVFAWGGLGTLIHQAIEERDYPVLQATILLIAVVFLVVNLAVDAAYAWLDPRVRLGTPQA